MTTADARRTREFMRGLRSTDCGRARLTADGGRRTADGSANPRAGGEQGGRDAPPDELSAGAGATRRQQ
jgi:hypothetical protein